MRERIAGINKSYRTGGGISTTKTKERKRERQKRERFGHIMIGGITKH